MQEVYWVEDGVLGGRCGPDCVPWEPAALHAGGVRAIVSLDRFGVDGDALVAAGIAHLPLYQPMILLESEQHRSKFLEIVPQVLAFVDEMQAGQSGPVIVHCHYGRDRTGCVLACCLVVRQGMSPDAAVALIRRHQTGALTAPGYAEAVEQFARLRRRE